MTQKSWRALAGALISFAATALCGLETRNGSAQVVGQVQSSTDCIFAASFSPDGRIIAGAGARRILHFWEAKSGTRRRDIQIETSNGSVRAVVYSADGQLLATAGDDGVARIWDTKTYKLEQALPEGTRISSIAFTPDGRMLAVSRTTGVAPSGGYVNEVSFWDTERRRFTKTLKTETPEPTSPIAISPDGRTLATGSGTPKLWDIRTGHEKRTLKPERGNAHTVRFSPDGKLLAAGCSWVVKENGPRGVEIADELYFWNVGTGAVQLRLKMSHPRLTAFAISTDGKSVVTGTDGPVIETPTETRITNEVNVWDLSTGRVTHTLSGELAPIFTIAISPDGNTLLRSDGDAAVLLDMKRARLRCTLTHNR